MTRKQAIELRKRIKRYVDAEIADSWKGGSDPVDFDSIEKELKDARSSLSKLIKDLTTQA